MGRQYSNGIDPSRPPPIYLFPKNWKTKMVRDRAQAKTILPPIKTTREPNTDSLTKTSLREPSKNTSNINNFKVKKTKLANPTGSKFPRLKFLTENDINTALRPKFAFGSKPPGSKLRFTEIDKNENRTASKESSNRLISTESSVSEASYELADSLSAMKRISIGKKLRIDI